MANNNDDDNVTPEGYWDGYEFPPEVPHNDNNNNNYDDNENIPTFDNLYDNQNNQNNNVVQQQEFHEVVQEVWNGHEWVPAEPQVNDDNDGAEEEEEGMWINDEWVPLGEGDPDADGWFVNDEWIPADNPDWVDDDPILDFPVDWTFFEKQYRLRSLYFARYRESGHMRSQLEDERDGDERDWMNHPFPLSREEGTRDYKTTRGWHKESYNRRFNSDFQTLDIRDEPDLYDTEIMDDIRKSYAKIKRHFKVITHPTDRFEDKFRLGRILRYGRKTYDMRLFLYDAPFGRGDARQSDYALRVGSDALGPIAGSQRILREKQLQRLLHGSEHTKQAIDPTLLGMRKQKEFSKAHPIYGGTWDNLDSDIPLDVPSSGEEGPPDTPLPKTRTRKELIETLPLLMDGKWKSHDERKSDYSYWWEIERPLGILQHFEEPEEAKRSDPNDKWNRLRVDFMLFDYPSHGTLADLIDRLIKQREFVPNRVLWHFWHCLVKSIIGMEYPVRKFHPFRRNVLNVNSGLSEAIPASENLRSRGKRVVHFDIHPGNVTIERLLIFAPTTEHSLVPRLCIHNYVDAKVIKPEKSNAYYTDLRTRGTYGYYAPEQFGVEWDHIAPGDERGWELADDRNAGSYGPWTNVWGIAMTMWVLITKYMPPTPPERVMKLYSETEPVHYCALLNEGDPTYWSYDQELRETLRRCLRHNWWERPQLHELLAGAEAGVGRPQRGETDEFIRDWVKRLYVGAFLLLLLFH